MLKACCHIDADKYFGPVRSFAGRNRAQLGNAIDAFDKVVSEDDIVFANSQHQGISSDCLLYAAFFCEIFLTTRCKGVLPTYHSV